MGIACKIRISVGVVRLGIFALLSLHLGCDRPDTHLASPPNPDLRSRVDAAIALTSTVVVSRNDAVSAGNVSGTYRLLVQDLNSTLRVILPLGREGDSWPRTVQLPDGLNGRYRVTAFLDRSDNAQFDDCPFPASPFDSESAEKRDNLQVTQEVFLPSPESIDMVMSHRICGPGDEETGISGRIEGLEGSTRLFMLAERQTTVSQFIDDGADVVIRTPLLLGQDVDGVHTFSVGEFLSGRYRLTIFTDEDGDLTPSPCQEAPGGADAFVIRINDVDVVSGTRSVLDPIAFVRGDCEEALTGLTGTISVDQESIDEASTAVSDDGDPLNVDAGNMWVLLNSCDGSSDTIRRQIQPSLSARPMPLKYTVTGVPAGLWNVTVFLDRDADGVFSPCNEEVISPCDVRPEGFDKVSGTGEQIEIVEGQVVDAGHVELKAQACGSNAKSGVTATVSVESEMGAIGSGRKIWMVLEPEDPGAEILAYPIFDNHQALLGIPTLFTKEIPAGRYRGRLFLDTDRDDKLSRCDEDPDGYGDRQVSREFDLQLNEGELHSLGRVALENIGCRIPETQLTLRIVPPVQLPLSPPRELSVRIDDIGGWTETITEVPRIEDNLWEIGPISLVAGTFSLTVYVDTDGNGEFTGCDEGGGDQYGGSHSHELGRLNPMDTTEIRLEALVCP